jgi:hypothetical protein
MQSSAWQQVASLPEEELEAFHHSPAKKSVAAATATSRRTENLRETFYKVTTFL